MREVIDMQGKKIGWWTVGERTDPPDHVTSSRGQAWWMCRCKCGTESPHTGGHLRSGKSKSCGCRGNKKKSRYANIKTRFPRRHDLKNDPLYSVWSHLLLRCYQTKYKQYKNYGAKGITVCDHWRRAPNFIKWAKENGWKPNHSLELKEGETVFSPDTVFWIPKAEKISRMKCKNGNPEYRTLAGKKFGLLTVVGEGRYTTPSDVNRLAVKCKCQCGNEILVVPFSLVSRKTKSCGCRGRKFEWSREFEHCILCKRTKFRHAKKGLCLQCYHQKAKNPDYTPAEHLIKENRWATFYDACVQCNKTSAKHHSRGICRTCKFRNYYHKTIKGKRHVNSHS